MPARRCAANPRGPKLWRVAVRESRASRQGGGSLRVSVRCGGWRAAVTPGRQARAAQRGPGRRYVEKSVACAVTIPARRCAGNPTEVQ